jgi:hypothetical protein
MDEEEDDGLVEYAIRRLAGCPNEVAGACLRGLTPTAIDVIANASDEELSATGVDFVTLMALRAACSFALTIRQARRYADLLERAGP